MFLGLFLTLYYFYSLISLIVWNKIFYRERKVCFIYALTQKLSGRLEIENITLKYYFGFCSKRCGDFYVKMYDRNGVHHFGYSGSLGEEFSKMLDAITSFPPPECTPRRKTVVMYDGTKTIEMAAALSFLDDYYRNLQHAKHSCKITRLSHLFQLAQISCTRVKIVTLFPFSQKVLDADEADIYDLYPRENA